MPQIIFHSSSAAEGLVELLEEDDLARRATFPENYPIREVGCRIVLYTTLPDIWYSEEYWTVIFTSPCVWNIFIRLYFFISPLKTCMLTLVVDRSGSLYLATCSLFVLIE